MPRPWEIHSGTAFDYAFLSADSENCTAGMTWEQLTLTLTLTCDLVLVREYGHLFLMPTRQKVLAGWWNGNKAWMCFSFSFFALLQRMY